MTWSSIIRLDQYASATIDQWATVTAQMMIDDVNARNRQFWRQQSSKLAGGWLSSWRIPTSDRPCKTSCACRIELIKSLPRQAALQRFTELALGAMTDGQRAAGLGWWMHHRAGQQNTLARQC